MTCRSSARPRASRGGSPGHCTRTGASDTPNSAGIDLKMLHLEFPNSSVTIVVEELCIFVFGHLLNLFTISLLCLDVLKVATSIWRPTLVHRHSGALVEALPRKWLG